MSSAFNTIKLVKRNLSFYRRQTLQVILAIALTTAIISGAFLIGASVKNSLRTAMQNRLGKVTYGLFQTERWFKADIGQRLTNSNNSPCAALISVPAYITAANGQTVKVNLYGIDQIFFTLAPQQNSLKNQVAPEGKLPLRGGENKISCQYLTGYCDLGPNKVLINRTAALLTGLKVGESFAVRCFKPSLMPGDTAWSSRDSGSVGFRLEVTKEISPASFANFNPLNSQQAPANIFVDRHWLAERLDRPAKANMLLCTGSKPPANLKENLKLADYGLSLKKLTNGTIELKSDRVFISPAVVKAAGSLKFNEQPIFSYFVNSITANKKMTPYSFITGIDQAPSGISLSSNETVINSWLADDLKLKIGDKLAITYYTFGDNGELAEASANLKVKAIIPVSNAADLMPKFPGMSDAASCNDWDPGIPIDLELIRKKDEIYWDKYRGTPKLFIALETAQKLWGCRFGKLTAIRFGNIKRPKQLRMNVERRTSNIEHRIKKQSSTKKIIKAKTNASDQSNDALAEKKQLRMNVEHRTSNIQHRIKKQSVTKKIIKANNNYSDQANDALAEKKQLRRAGFVQKSLLSALKPTELGFSWRPLNSIGHHGVANAVDFSGLFFGLSFFVIIAGIVLSGLLYRLHLEQRAGEFALLKSMGYSNNHLRRVLLLEAVVILTAGIVIGIGGAYGYSYLIICALNTVWNNIAGSIPISLNANPQAIMLGAGITVPITASVLLVALRKIINSNLKGILVKSDFHHKGSRIYLATGTGALLAGAVIIFIGIKSGGTGIGTFFGAAALLFVGMVCISGVIIRIIPEYLKGQGISTISTALRNNSRHFSRSLAVVIIMALGIFLTLAVSVNRTRIRVADSSKQSGTGGFGWYVETAIPVKGNLNDSTGRRRYHLKLPANRQDRFRRNVEHRTSNIQHRIDRKYNSLLGSNIVQLPMMDGGAAGCLNLNRVTRPRLLGVPPNIFNGRFSFKTPGTDWNSLQQNDTDVIPAIADQNVILWSLGLKIGDTLDYPGANGKIYNLKFIAGLNNSILQGAVLISRANLRRMFPGISGSRVLLVEQSSQAVGAELSRSLAKLGPDIETCTSRLNRFGAIQNSYLMVFLSLGGIGLLIGTLGLSIILRRNLLERSGELAWLRSAGFSRKRLAFMLTAEHLILFACAVLTGVIAATAAAISALLSPSSSPPWLEMILLIALLWIFAIMFIVTAAYGATSGDIITGLRGDSE